MNTLQNIFSLLFFLFTLPLFGQDPVFSNFGNIPLELSPAFTGVITNGNVRGSAIYRNQWGTLPKTDAYSTYAVNLDGNICSVSQTDQFGWGIGFLGDQAGNFPLSRNKAYLTIAYRKFLGRNKSASFFSIGAEGGILQYNLKKGDFRFDEQFNGFEYDPNVLGETFNEYNFISQTWGAGIFYMKPGKDQTDFSYSGGISFKNLNRPEIKFIDYNLKAPELNMRTVVHAAVNLGKPERSFATRAKVNLIYQRPQWQLLAVTELLFHNSQHNFTFFPGVGVRFSGSSRSEIGHTDAIILSGKLDIGWAVFFFSYDVNVSPLKIQTKSVGTVEFGLTVRFGESICKYVYCPVY